MDSFMGKTRKPKFELHLKICDLNNVPLVSGNSFIKWHLSHSIHAEHRGRTEKCPIANHRVNYSFCRIIPRISISVDKTNNLAECPIEFEIIQEFGAAEKITLGIVRLNLSEYVEESEAYARENPPLAATATTTMMGRRRTSSLGISPTNVATVAAAAGQTPRKSLEKNSAGVFDGIVRRYLMQESKINSTLKISILMVQVDGDRGFIAPPLRTAPTFGGIAGVVASEAADDDTTPTATTATTITGSVIPSISKPKDAAEVQDLYRRTLAASWLCLPTELPADECIEDIFSGGNGWKTRLVHYHGYDAMGNTDTEDDDGHSAHGTLRPNDFRTATHHLNKHIHPPSRPHHHHHHHHLHYHQHRRNQSGGSDISSMTVTGTTTTTSTTTSRSIKDALDLSRRPSLTSLAPTLGSDRTSSSTARLASGLGEEEVRDNLVAWRLPGGGLVA